ncbi:MAG: carbamoyltransferase HypF [Deltaproteobacteria bacterium]|nr:carbamoyltransferase HypF [Deltaproteobacteria bacterium]
MSHEPADFAAAGGELVRVRGQVQGVGFRPTVAKLALSMDLPGWVRNDADGVTIALGGTPAQRDRFVAALLADLPPLARIQDLARAPWSDELPAYDGRFAILESPLRDQHGATASIVPDAVTCPACVAEILDPLARRYRYPFTNCTHCGPRFTIATRIPWDRANTSMTAFDLCASCRAEYDDPTDRRYHAEPIACHACGPRTSLARADGRSFTVDTMSMLDAVDAIATLLQRGQIVAVEGLGGFNLLCDATDDAVVERLRARKCRPDKPLAMLARDLATIERYAELSEAERAALRDPAGPIVLVRARAEGPQIAAAVVAMPAVRRPWYGFMLPSTPLHVLALRRFDRPAVCTSGNRSEEPQVCDPALASTQLGDIADWIVSHDRPIHNRVDDSVVRVVAGATRVLRRARGLAPAPLPLPPGFAEIAAREAVLAMGGDLKAAVCMTRASDAILSQHLGDLDDAAARVAYVEQLERLVATFEHRPTRVAIDRHRDGRAAACGWDRAAEAALELEAVGHHHAHFAACLGENAVPLGCRDVMGVVLDGLGVGDDDVSLWGAEFLCGDYASTERVATLRPIRLLGGDKAAREPWRCLYAHLRAHMGWGELLACWGDVDVVRRLHGKPIAMLEPMMERGLGSPHASSAGRLFDAVAAALDLCFEGQSHEAQAAMTLEALVTDDVESEALAELERGDVYPWTLPHLAAGLPGAGLPYLEPLGVWRAVLGDLAAATPRELIAARFHVAFAHVIATTCTKLVERRGTVARTVALSGGCFQNAVLHRRVAAELGARGFDVLAHRSVPANDGGLAFGQALTTLARRDATQRS